MFQQSEGRAQCYVSAKKIVYIDKLKKLHCEIVFADKMTLKDETLHIKTFCTFQYNHTLFGEQDGLVIVGSNLCQIC